MNAESPILRMYSMCMYGSNDTNTYISCARRPRQRIAVLVPGAPVQISEKADFFSSPKVTPENSSTCN
jgi:hypothetical protein